jgi:MFS family permease
LYFQYGFVFGIVNLTAFICCPIFSYVGKIIGPKKIYNIGGLTLGITTIVFGTLIYIKDAKTFIDLSYLLK